MSLSKITKKNLSTQVKEILLQAIINKSFSDTGQLPNELLLADQLGVSRITIRDALKSLEQEGYITRTAGKGTFANYEATKIKSRLSSSYAFYELLRLNGMKPSSKVIAVEKTSARDLKTIDLPEQMNQTIYVRKILFYGDGIPAVYCENYINGDFVDDSFLDYGKKADAAFFNSLKRNFQFPETAYDVAHIRPSLVEGKLIELFHKKQQEPCLLILSTLYNQDHLPLIYSREYYNDQLIQFSEIRVNNIILS